MTVHIMFDTLCDSLLKLMRRCMKITAIEQKYGSDLVFIDCKDVKLQLQDKNIVIGKNTRKALKELTAEQQKQVMLGI